MLNILKVNFKKSLLADGCLLVIAFLFFMTVAVQTSMFNVQSDETLYFSYYSVFSTFETCFVVAACYVLFKNFSYNKRKVSCDLHYSLPLTKRQLFLGQTLYSILELSALYIVLVPTMLIVMGVHEKPETAHLQYGMIFLYTIFVFLYTIVNFLLVSPFVYYANDTLDTIFYLLFICLMPFLLSETIQRLLELLIRGDFIHISLQYINFQNVIPFASIFTLEKAFISRMYFIENETGVKDAFWSQLEWTIIAMTIVFAAIAFLLTVYFVKKDKSERSQEIDTKWFGYKTFLPIVFIIFSAYAGLMSGNPGDVLSLLLSIVAPFVLMVIRRRSFKIAISDIIWVAATPISFAIFASIAYGIMLHRN
jgi:hypothetical protein